MRVLGGEGATNLYDLSPLTGTKLKHTTMQTRFPTLFDMT